MFYDRYEAGRDVAEQLIQYAETDAIICAIPRGGILTGVAVAKRLGLSLELLLVTKMPVGKSMCAVSEFGTSVCDTDQELSESEVSEIVADTRAKRLAYTDSDQLPDWKGKTVIVVDDGAESGLTIKVAITALLQQSPAKIIVALPAASASVTWWLDERVDELVVVKIEPEFKGSIHEHYSHYPEVFDKEVHVAYWHAKHMFEQQGS
jgi:putative phosphoribosyl transferase